MGRRVEAKEPHLVQIVVEAVPPFLESVRVVDADVIQSLQGELAVGSHGRK